MIVIILIILQFLCQLRVYSFTKRKDKSPMASEGEHDSS